MILCWSIERKAGKGLAIATGEILSATGALVQRSPHLVKETDSTQYTTHHIAMTGQIQDFSGTLGVKVS
jgi:hypothetical protein